MPTFNQLARKGREVLALPRALLLPSEELQLPEEAVHHHEQPQKRGVCTAVRTMTPKSPTLLCVKLPVSA